MSVAVTRFPGTGCLYYCDGRCAYGESVNPGLDEAVQCPEEARLVAAYDRFLEQMERFGLQDGQAAAMWERRFEGMPPPGALCEEYVEVAAPADGEAEAGAAGDDEAGLSSEALLDCTSYREGICLLRLPTCEGVCPRFRMARLAALAVNEEI